MNFQDKLDAIIQSNNSLISIGLDPDLDKIPGHFKTLENPLFEFNKKLIEATYDVVAVYKPQSAGYEAYGAEGIAQLKLTCEYLNKKHPHIPLILDAKRGDIGSTNENYARYAFDHLETDALTLHPYLGKESLEPFLRLKDKGFFILCRTTNKGGGEFQDLVVEGVPLYQYIAAAVVERWNKNNNCMLVVGATYPEELSYVREIVGDMTILVPGIGAQGGDLQKVLQVGLNSHKAGLLIHSSRSIMYAGHGSDFAEAARAEAQRMREEINKYR